MNNDKTPVMRGYEQRELRIKTPTHCRWSITAGIKTKKSYEKYIVCSKVDILVKEISIPRQILPYSAGYAEQTSVNLSLTVRAFK